MARSAAVIGLGRFGAALALELERSGTEVLGIDIDATAVSTMTGQLTQVVAADAAQEDTAQDLGLPDFDRVVIAIGSDIVASCLTASIALGHGVDVWAKAISQPHARILTKLGVEHVVFPEQDMGQRVAHLVRGGVLDYVQFDDDYAMVTIPTPADLAGTSLARADTRARHGVSVVAATDASGRFTHATAETVPHPGGRLIVAGTVRQVERMSTRGLTGNGSRRARW